MKYSESTLISWTAPLSQTEKQRADNAVNMIKTAIKSDLKISKMNIEVFVQGSYANNTNVRSNSDVDVCVMLKDTFHSEYAKGKNREDYGFIESNLTFFNYREMVKDALINKFGNSNVSDGNKSIKIDENTYHVNADVVPTFQLRNYYYDNSIDPENYKEGTWLVSKTGEEIANYPKIHIHNGTIKNNITNYKYKKLVRIMKHIKNNMVDDGITNGDIITSFLIECLVWNIPIDTINSSSTWTNTVKNSILYLYNAFKESKHAEWCEVSDMLYLFRNRKWTDSDVKKWLIDAWSYLEY